VVFGSCACMCIHDSFTEKRQKTAECESCIGSEVIYGG
jgi:hypothetical protein